MDRLLTPEQRLSIALDRSPPLLQPDNLAWVSVEDTLGYVGAVSWVVSGVFPFRRN